MSGQLIGASFDVSQFLAARRNLGILANRLPMFQQRAIGTLQRKLPVEARRDIQREYSLSARRISKDLGVRVRGPEFTLTGYFRGIGLRNFQARQTAAGVTSAVFLGQVRSLRRSAFLATLLPSNPHVAKRIGEKRKMRKGNYIGEMRQHLQTQYGPTVAQMLRKGRRPERLADFARGVLADEIERQIEGYAKGRPIPGAN